MMSDMPDICGGGPMIDRQKPSDRGTVIYVVTEDWYFWSHRLPLARAARDAGWSVLVATRVQAHGARMMDEGFRVVALPWRRGGGGILAEISTIAQLWTLFRREKPALVHLVALKAIVYGGLAARLAGVSARVGTVAGLGYVFTSPRIKARLLRPLMRVGLAVSLGGAKSWVTVQNPDDGHRLAELRVIDPARTVLIRGSGVDLMRFSPASDRGEVHEEIRVGMACRLVRDKGIAMTVGAVAALRREGMAIVLHLAGALDPESRDGHTRAEIEAWVATGAVIWHGPRSDIPQFWNDMDIAAYPSTYGEGIPKTLLEAAACGKPIVTLDMPGCRETVEDGKTGYLVPRDDDRTLIDRLRLLAQEGDLRRRFGVAARRKAADEFGDDRIVAETLAVYDRAVGKRMKG